MSKCIKIGRELVPVSDELYQAYYQMGRRRRYLERDIKAGRIDVDPAREAAVFMPGKEDSLERLMEQGADFADQQMVEDMICDKAMLLILQAAVAELNRAEQGLIKDLYYNHRTVREVARDENVSHVAVFKRQQRVLDKLRKFFL
ncbi:MAG: sigma-70 protein [Peptococcaceae bacterium BRH_c8a]|nr:MAG: sigma-70 protein [Peptococcaceae bacterium BRH_c8a]